ncbi:hypothetical protein B0H19DRAFT_1228265 [Mycena capillaripes]|nr:hypothetical protein B0H19DRAFT_1228265 [Mycena capillaripes]
MTRIYPTARILPGNRSRVPPDRHGFADPNNGEPLDPVHQTSVAKSDGITFVMAAIVAESDRSLLLPPQIGPQGHQRGPYLLIQELLASRQLLSAARTFCLGRISGTMMAK